MFPQDKASYDTTDTCFSVCSKEIFSKKFTSLIVSSIEKNMRVILLLEFSQINHNMELYPDSGKKMVIK